MKLTGCKCVCKSLTGSRYCGRHGKPIVKQVHKNLDFDRCEAEIHRHIPSVSHDIQGVYDAVNILHLVMTECNTPKPRLDPFHRSCKWGMSDEEYREHMNVISRSRSESMAIGVFHETMFGIAKGYMKLKPGHETGLDIMSVDGTEAMELKNATHTMNSSSASSVANKLRAWASRGMKAILVQINCKDNKVVRPKNMGADIETWSGRDAYARIMGCDTFYDDLQVFLRVMISGR